MCHVGHGFGVVDEGVEVFAAVGCDLAHGYTGRQGEDGQQHDDGGDGAGGGFGEADELAGPFAGEVDVAVPEFAGCAASVYAVVEPAVLDVIWQDCWCFHVRSRFWRCGLLVSI